MTATNRATSKQPSTARAALRLALVAMALVSLAACGDYGGGGVGSATGGGSPATPPPSGGGSLPDPTTSMPVFETTVYPVLTAYCASCHSGAGPGTPNIAHGDPVTAYSATVNTQKVNLGNPIASRLVQRLAVDLHYCWGVCTDNAEVMRAAIADWASQIAYTGGGVDPGSIRTNQLVINDGVELDSSDQRYSDHVIAQWEFKEGSGTTAADTSGVAPAMDLELQGSDVTWLTNYGIDIVDGRAFSPRDQARKLYDLIADASTGTGQYSIEAWIVPANVTQGDNTARIVTYSSGSGTRNFTMGQVLYQYDFRNRNASSAIGNNGTPSLRTYDMDRDLQATLQHAVLTYDPIRGRAIYVDGQWTDDPDDQEAAPLWNWRDDQHFVVGNEVSNDRQWQGKVQFLAIHKQALTDAQINQNYLAGVGRKVVLRFDTSAWAGPGSYLEFLVSELDGSSYLFCQPVFYASNANGLRIAGLRIVVNGLTPVNGQAFTNVDAASFGQPTQVSRLCSVIPSDLGALQDVFEIDMEIVDNFQHDYVYAVNPPGVDNSVLPPVPVEGLRDFKRIGAAMASITSVTPATPAVRQEFDSIQTQLPAGFDIRTFVSSNQMGIAKLALEYCDALVEDASPQGARESFFGVANPFGFDADVTTAFAGNNRDLILDPIVDQMVQTNVPNQPAPTAVRAEVDALITTLVGGCPPECDATRTRSIVKAACTAVLASGAVTLH